MSWLVHNFWLIPALPLFAAGQQSSGTECRQKVAHGVSRGFDDCNTMSPGGAKELWHTHSPVFWSISSSAQRSDRPRAYPRLFARQAGAGGIHWKGESQLGQVGSQAVFESLGFLVAGWLFSFQREPFAEAGGPRLYCEPGRTSSEALFQRGVDCLAQEARDRIRRTISLGVAMKAAIIFSVAPPGLILFARSNPRLTPWATFCRRSAAGFRRHHAAGRFKGTPQ